MNYTSLNLSTDKAWAINKNIIIEYFFFLFIDFLLFYSLYIYLSHYFYITIYIPIRVIAVAITMTTFITLCSAYRKLSGREIYLCVGFVSVSILECINTYYLLTKGFDIAESSSIFKWLRFSARFAVVISIYFSIRFAYERFMHRKNSIALALILCSLGIIIDHAANVTGLVSLLRDKFFYPDNFIIYFELVVISCCSLILMLRGCKNDRFRRVSGKYMLFAVLFAIPADLIYALSVKQSVFLVYLSYSLIFISYIFITKTAVLSLLELPYRELLSSQERTKALLDDMPIGLAVYDEDRHLSFINKAGAKALDIVRPADYISGNVCFDEHDDKDPFTEDILRISKYKLKSLSNVIRFVKKNGERMLISTRVSAVKNNVLVVFEDFKAVDEASLRFQSQLILDSIADIVLVIDNEYKVVLYNDAAKKIFDAYNDIIHNEDIRNLFQKAKWDINDIIPGILNRRQLNIETSIEANSDYPVYMLMYTAPIINNTGKVVGAILMASDITEYKKGQDDLIQQEKLALLGQMGAGIVHETKNYLTTIKGSSQILKLIASNTEVVKYASKIDQATNEVNRIITEFLNMTKPSQPNMKRMYLGDLLAKITHMLESMTKVNLVELELDCSFQDEQICCDEGQIKQVILNIVKNAIEAMEHVREPRISISTGLRGNSYIYISITDNGPGMPNSLLEKVGTPFFTTKKNGTGLGINVSKKIVKEHGGVLEIKSAIDRGTTFYIILPRM